VETELTTKDSPPHTYLLISNGVERSVVTSWNKYCCQSNEERKSTWARWPSSRILDTIKS